MYGTITENIFLMRLCLQNESYQGSLRFLVALNKFCPLAITLKRCPAIPLLKLSMLCVVFLCFSCLVCIRYSKPSFLIICLINFNCLMFGHWYPQHLSRKSHFCWFKYLHIWRDFPDFPAILEDRYCITVQHFLLCFSDY